MPADGALAEAPSASGYTVPCSGPMDEALASVRLILQRRPNSVTIDGWNERLCHVVAGTGIFTGTPAAVSRLVPRCTSLLTKLN